MTPRGIYERVPAEDVVGYIRRRHSILAWAIDGASTLTAIPFATFPNLTNAGWFVRRLDQRLREACRDVVFSPALLQGIIRSVREEYGRAGGFSQPLWAWPTAAALCVEIARVNGWIEMSIYRYADCFVETCQDALTKTGRSPFGTHSAPAFDPWKPFSGFRGQKLAALWRRRVQQQMNVVRNVLTINPVSALHAVEEQRIIASPVHILVGSDGLSRLWDTYRAMTKAEAMQFLVEHGLHALLRELRAYEANSTTGSVDLKRRDDASGVHLFLA